MFPRLGAAAGAGLPAVRRRLTQTKGGSSIEALEGKKAVVLGRWPATGRAKRRPGVDGAPNDGDVLEPATR